MSSNMVPWLRAGKGETPQDGGCVLQVVDWVDRCGWTDEPPCVHPVIARIAVVANDRLDDRGRQRLVGLIPRLIGTASDDPVLRVRLAVFAARRVLPVFERVRPGDDRPRRAILAAEAWVDNPTAIAAAFAYAAAYAAYAASDADADAAYADAAASAYAAYASAYAAYAAASAAADAADYAYAAADVASSACRVVAAAAGVFDLLIAVLNEYDRLTGRGHPAPVDLAPVCQAMAAGAA